MAEYLPVLVWIEDFESRQCLYPWDQAAAVASQDEEGALLRSAHVGSIHHVQTKTPARK